MQIPRVSLPTVGAREVRHGNTRPTTRTARFFAHTVANWTDQGRPIELAVVTVAAGRYLYSRRRWLAKRLQPLEPNSQSVIFCLYSNAQHAVNKRRTSPGSWSQKLASDSKINEIRQRRPKWRQFQKVVSLAGLHHIMKLVGALLSIVLWCPCSVTVFLLFGENFVFLRFRWSRSKKLIFVSLLKSSTNCYVLLIVCDQTRSLFSGNLCWTISVGVTAEASKVSEDRKVVFSGLKRFWKVKETKQSRS